MPGLGREAHVGLVEGVVGPARSVLGGRRVSEGDPGGYRAAARKAARPRVSEANKVAASKGRAGPRARWSGPWGADSRGALGRRFSHRAPLLEFRTLTVASFLASRETPPRRFFALLASFPASESPPPRHGAGLRPVTVPAVTSAESRRRSLQRFLHPEGPGAGGRPHSAP